MVDLKGQYAKIKNEIDSAIQDVINSARFIKGPSVQKFEDSLSQYLDGAHVVSCGNGTDALQIALMALELKPGDEVIVPAFTYVATAEVIALLGLVPKMVDVDPDTFNISLEGIKSTITSKTKAIVPVHLYGQSSDMEAIMEVANQHNVFVVEDNAQAIGGSYTFSNGKTRKTGTIGHIGCTSFFPSKNLGCYGDGGALYTHNKDLADRIRMIANHGQRIKYHHDSIGVNSRLDAIQAAVLSVKLKYMNNYVSSRNEVARSYDNALSQIDELSIPFRVSNSSHVFHQYTIKVQNGKRDQLKEYLAKREIPSMIYYPLALYKQKAYERYGKGMHLKVTEDLCNQVLSLPIHTEMTSEMTKEICQHINHFFKRNNTIN